MIIKIFDTKFGEIPGIGMSAYIGSSKIVLFNIIPSDIQ